MASNSLSVPTRLLSSAPSLGSTRLSLDSRSTASFPEKLRDAKSTIETKPAPIEPSQKRASKSASHKASTKSTETSSGKPGKVAAKPLSHKGATDPSAADLVDVAPDASSATALDPAGDPATDQVVLNEIEAQNKHSKVESADEANPDAQTATAALAAAISPGSTPMPLGASATSQADGSGKREVQAVAVRAKDADAAAAAFKDSQTGKPVKENGASSADNAMSEAIDTNGTAVVKAASPSAEKRKAAPALGDIDPAITKDARVSQTSGSPNASLPVAVPTDTASSSVAVPSTSNDSTEPKPTDTPSSDVGSGVVLTDHSQRLVAHANTPAAATPQAAATLEARFTEANHSNIVTGLKTQLAAHGGTMQIRLDPPELGALQVIVEMRHGVMSATFQTSNDDATRLLSHSLGQLKTALEAQGVTVDKIQVQQSPRDSRSTGEDPNQQQQRPAQDEQQARQDQQRKEMLQKMWQKLSIGSDPVDLVA